MKNNSTPLFILFLFSMSINLSHAQIDNTNQTGNNNSKRGVPAFVTGTVVDANTKEPLEYATVTLFSKIDSTVVTGGITNEKGIFQINTRSGKYYAKIEFISYQSHFIPNVSPTREHISLSFGTIELQPNATNLEEIEVRAEKSMMQMSLDKRVFNVGKDLANQGGTAADILDNVPSVTVDVEGNVSLRGSENVRILVNGKPSGLVGNGDTNGLRQIPANLLDKIEVVTNPSARYEAEGMAGIINIVLRQERKKGLNGSFDFTVGYPHNYGTAINLNFRKNNFNLFLNYGLYYRNSPGSGFTYQEFYSNPDTTDFLYETRTMDRGGWSNSFRFGSDFFLNKYNTITTSFSFRTSNEDNITELEYQDYVFSYPNNLTDVSIREDNELEEEAELEFAINYSKTFDQEKRTFTVDIQYETEDELEKSTITEGFLTPEYLPSGRADLEQRTNNDEGYSRFLLKMDYVHPFGKEGKFEAGLQSSIRDIRNDYLVEEKMSGNWENRTDVSNDFEYDENIHGLYAQYGNKHNKFSYLLGLRGELSDVTTRLIDTDSINARNYFNVFPTAHVTYDLANQNAIQLSYSYRIRRPSFRSLNPFFSFSNNRNIYGGNPDLDPVFTHSFELQHIKIWEKGTFSSAIYYRHSNGVTERIRSIFIEEDITYTITRPTNLSTEDSYGLEFTYSYDPSKSWRLNGDFNFFRQIRDGTFEEQTFHADSYSWTTRLTSRWTFWNKTDFQLRGNYRGPLQSVQGKRKAYYYIDLSISKDILKNNGTLTLSVNDLLNSRKHRYTNELSNAFSEGEFQWRARQVKLTLNYRLNQKKQRNSGNRRGGQGGGSGGGEGIEF